MESQQITSKVESGDLEPMMNYFDDVALEDCYRPSSNDSCQIRAGSSLAYDIDSWLKEADLVEEKHAVLAWCAAARIKSIEDLIPLVAELALDIGLTPARALSLRSKSAAMVASAQKKQATLSPSKFTREQRVRFGERWVDFALTLADELQMATSQAELFWRIVANSSASASRCCGDKDLAEKYSFDFAKRLVVGIELLPPQDDLVFNRVANFFGVDQNTCSPSESLPCYWEETHPIKQLLQSEPSESIDIVSIRNEAQEKLMTVSQDSLHSLHGQQRATRPDDFPERRTSHLRKVHRRGENDIRSPNRCRVGGDSPTKHVRLKLARDKPSWDTSWHDDGRLHASQQKYFDPMTKKQMYTMMHYRSCSSDAKHLRDVCTDESSRKCVSIVSTSPGSPHSSTTSVFSSSPSSCSDISRPLSKMSRSRSGAACSNGTTCMRRITHSEETLQMSTHGFRLGARGSSGKPWSSAPFYNDREHPFMGHYYDHEGERAAYSRGKRPQSVHSASVPNFFPL